MEIVLIICCCFNFAGLLVLGALAYHGRRKTRLVNENLGTLFYYVTKHEVDLSTLIETLKEFSNVLRGVQQENPPSDQDLM